MIIIKMKDSTTKTISPSSVQHSNSIEGILAQGQEYSKGLERLEKTIQTMDSVNRMANIFYCPVRLTEGIPLHLKKGQLFESPQ